jgi:hypothetical protein
MVFRLGLLLPIPPTNRSARMLAPRQTRWYRLLVAAFLLTGFAAEASEYNAAHCSLVLGTLNFHWEAVAGPNAPCTGIEFTNGTMADAADGTISMTGVSVSNSACIGTASYTLVLSPDKMTLSGFDTTAGVPMTLTRGPGEECFVGHWVLGAHDFVGHIAAAPFLAGGEIPALGNAGLLLLAGLLTIAGCGALAGRHRKAARGRLERH